MTGFIAGVAQYAFSNALGSVKLVVVYLYPLTDRQTYAVHIGAGYHSQRLQADYSKGTRYHGSGVLRVAVWSLPLKRVPV